jgi:periplasmic copper chaperone A
MWQKTICAIVLVISSNACWAGPYDPIVSKAWVGESVPGQTTATIQLNLTTVKAVKLISASSTLAEAIEFHSLMKQKGVIKRHVVPSLHIPEHSTTTFGANGLFLMMTGLKQPLKIGDQVPLTLQYVFPDKQVKTINAIVEVKPMELSYKHYGPQEVYDHH